MMETRMFSKIYYKDKYYSKFLTELLGKFVRNLPKKTDMKIYDMIRNNNFDSEIIEYVRNNLPINIVKTYDTNIRSQRIANTLYSFISEYNLTINDYLDIGCNNGQITVSFGNKMNLDTNHIYGVDVETFGQQKIKPVAGFMYMAYDGINIPFCNDSFDLITSLMVLHHVENLDNLLKEINRVIKIDGYLLIKEHNVYSEYIEWLVYIEHMMYDVMEYGLKYQDFVKFYNQYTFSKTKMAEMICSNGFELIKTSDDAFVKIHQKYNPTQNYYSLFRKVNNISIDNPAIEESNNGGSNIEELTSKELNN